MRRKTWIEPLTPSYPKSQFCKKCIFSVQILLWFFAVQFNPLKFNNKLILNLNLKLSRLYLGLLHFYFAFKVIQATSKIQTGSVLGLLAQFQTLRYSDNAWNSNKKAPFSDDNLCPKSKLLKGQMLQNVQIWDRPFGLGLKSSNRRI